MQFCPFLWVYQSLASMLLTTLIAWLGVCGTVPPSITWFAVHLPPVCTVHHILYNIIHSAESLFVTTPPFYINTANLYLMGNSKIRTREETISFGYPWSQQCQILTVPLHEVAVCSSADPQYSKQSLVHSFALTGSFVVLLWNSFVTSWIWMELWRHFWRRKRQRRVQKTKWVWDLCTEFPPRFPTYFFLFLFILHSLLWKRLRMSVCSLFRPGALRVAP